MKTPDEHLISAYLDGELSGESKLQLEELLARDPLLREELEAMRALGGAIQQHVRFEKELPHADFFSTQLMDQIERDQRLASPVETLATATPWWSFLSAKWLVGAAAACLAIGMLWNPLADTPKPSTQIFASYAPDDSVQVEAFHHAAAQASVVMLSNLPDIPDNHEIAGMILTHSEQDEAYAQTTLFDEEGKLRLVMSKDARNAPVMFDIKS